jgi:hypothetical protein
MFRKLYLAFGLGVIFLYAATSWLGWELFNGGTRSTLRTPFFYGGGYRGGK